MEVSDRPQPVLRCCVCAFPEVWTWVAEGPEGVTAVEAHDPGVDLRVEVVSGAVEVAIDGCLRTYREGESIIFPTGVPRKLSPVAE